MNPYYRFQCYRQLVNRSSWVCLILVFCFTFTDHAGGQKSSRPNTSSRKQSRSEQREDYYKKWLDQDVAYIITHDERKVFEKLATAEEKEHFIEQFWLRRDADPKTSINEFKEEHYRRLAYVNEKFSVGQPGWMTDRGRIYIIHGAPAEIESHPAGGHYARPSWRGGGFTQTYPFEIWRYRYIEGIGADVEIEFVDRRLTGQYQLAINPDEKDALLQVGRSGPTLAEMLRHERKADRPYFSPGNDSSRFQRAKDTPFERYATYVKIQKPPEIKFQDLKELVRANVTYQNLPVKVRQDFFRLNEDQVLVPITLEVENKSLKFKEDGASYSAEIAVYGLVTSITNRVVEEFETELEASYAESELSQGVNEKSIYQKILVLDPRMRYRLDLVVKDLNSGNLGVLRQLVAPPRFDSATLSVSSVILSDFIEQVDEASAENQMFLLGDVRIHPSLSNAFSTRKPVGVYVQVYGAGVDPGTQVPSFKLNYTISRAGKTLVELSDESGESVRFYSEQRVVLIRELPIAGLEPGSYRLDLKIQDRISRQEVTVSDKFQVSNL